MAVTAGVDLHHPLKLPHSIHPSQADCNGFMGATRAAIVARGRLWGALVPARVFCCKPPGPGATRTAIARAEVGGKRWFVPASFDYSRPAP